MITLSNEKYIFSLSDDNRRIKYFGTDKGNLLSCKQPPLFSVGLRDDAGELLVFSSESSLDCYAQKHSEGYCICFKDFPLDEMFVKIIISSDNSNLLRFGAEICCKLQLEWIEFPSVSVLDTFKDKGGSSRILWPYNEGAVVDDISARERGWLCHREPEYPSLGCYAVYPGMISTPMMAVISDLGGLYIGHHDKESNTTAVDFYRTEDGVRLQMRLYPGIKGGNYKTDFDTVLGVFDGDWYEAAEIYRSWFEKNLPDNFKKIEDNPALPDWYKESPVVLTYCVRGHFDTDSMEPNALFPYVNALPLVDKIAERLNSKILVILMHWEGTAPWAPPFTWPPYGGEEMLKEYIDALHSRGHLLGVYCSGMGWTQTSRLVDYDKTEMFDRLNLRDIMCVSPKGELPLSNICTAQRSGYDMCPSQRKTAQFLKNEVINMASADIDYVQLMDQNHGGTPYFCYSKSHGHPPVPGNWMGRQMIEILKEIKASIPNKKLLLGCESAAAQVFIPELLLSDNRFELNFMLGMPIPLYSYLYHSYVNNFMGNQVCGEESMADCITPENLWYRLGYSFVAGDFLTLVLNDEGKVQWAWGQSDFSQDYMPDSELTLDFVGRLNALRKGKAKKYLHSGKMTKPVNITAPTDFELEVRSGKKYIKPILTTCFMAKDGTHGQIIVNYTKKSVSCRMEEDMKITLCDASDSEKQLNKGDLFTVAPLSAVLLTF